MRALDARLFGYPGHDAAVAREVKFEVALLEILARGPVRSIEVNALHTPRRKLRKLCVIADADHDGCAELVYKSRRCLEGSILLARCHDSALVAVAVPATSATVLTAA